MLYLNGTTINIAGAGAERIPRSRRAECIAPHLGTRKAVEQHAVDRQCAVYCVNLHRLTLSPDCTPETGPLTASVPIHRRLWTLLLRPPRRGARTRTQLVVGHCGVSRNGACGAKSEAASDLTQLTDRWITGMVALSKHVICARQLREEACCCSGAGDWDPRASTPPSLVG
ncbi:hypothetical protein C3747_327g13 [Trypanosoma cruzi]|uniref:Uncharacterized protein n=1 Tax=Trypanosoma cruzi TaxID=5693 RepID=A0A2V2V6Y1_TRYCR|nr:hypothetical protein C3747_327g13 [Trypanosoma cruzi]